MNCKVCGGQILLSRAFHYVARDIENTGLSSLSGKEPELYDAFDCPICGSQNIVNTRKRAVKASGEEKSDGAAEVTADAV